MTIESKLRMPPLSLYVHMPWCVAKCPYCDFNSHALRGALPENDYVAALLHDLQHEIALIQDRDITSVFFGGGTPSLFSADSVARIVNAAMPCLSADAEITIEANPGTVEYGSFAGYKTAGVNRVSLGAQSFDDVQLKALGRIHGGDDIYRAVDDIRVAGIDNFNLDVMFGLPRQSVKSALTDVEKAIGLAPTHLSHYQLTIEPNTLFASQTPVLPDDDACWEMQTVCQEKLAEHCYRQYEVSAYAFANKQCRHNLNYWQFGDYIAVGAGAHGKVTDPAAGSITRYSKLRHPQAYIDATAKSSWTEQRWQISTQDRLFEFMLNALRLTDGFCSDDFEQRTGLDISEIRPQLARQRVQGLLDMRAGKIMPSAKGRAFLNELIMQFLPVGQGVRRGQGPIGAGFSRLSA